MSTSDDEARLDRRRAAAGMISSGSSRAEVARILGITPQVLGRDIAWIKRHDPDLLDPRPVPGAVLRPEDGWVEVDGQHTVRMKDDDDDNADDGRGIEGPVAPDSVEASSTSPEGTPSLADSESAATGSDGSDDPVPVVIGFGPDTRGSVDRVERTPRVASSSPHEPHADRDEDDSYDGDVRAWWDAESVPATGRVTGIEALKSTFLSLDDEGKYDLMRRQVREARITVTVAAVFIVSVIITIVSLWR